MIGRLLIGLTGLATLLYAGALVYFADRLTPGPGGPPAGDAILLSVAATLGISLLHVGSCLAAQRRPPRLFYVLFIGALARLVLLFGTPGPLLEGDHERLRLESRLVNLGVDPYRYRPADLLDDAAEDDLRPADERRELAAIRAELTSAEDSPRPDRVRRPDLRSTSTPAAHAIGAVADRFKPANTSGLAFLVLCADTLAIFLLLLALRQLELPLSWVIVYAWCPVLLKECYTTLGVDAFVLPGLAALVYAIVSRRRVLAGMGAAALMALRPAFLLFTPMLLRRSGFVSALLALALVALTFAPSLVPADRDPARMAEASVHVWRHHEYNSVAEAAARTALRGVERRAENSLAIGGVEIVRPDQPLAPVLAKLACLVLLLGIVAFLVIRLPDRVQAADHPGLTDLFVTVAALLLVAPVLTPAMTLWLLPILTVRAYGVAWLALPGLASVCALTHLNGPDAADYALPGTALSYRVATYGAFALLLLLDRLRRRTLFPSHAAREEDIVWNVGLEPEPELEFEIPVYASR